MPKLVGRSVVLVGLGNTAEPQTGTRPELTHQGDRAVADDRVVG